MKHILYLKDPVYPRLFYKHLCHSLTNSRLNQKKNHWLENLEGSIFAWLFGCLVGNVGNSSDVTLAFEDAQIIQPFSREKTYNTDDTDDTEDTDDTDDTDVTEDTEDTTDTDYTDETADRESTESRES